MKKTLYLAAAFFMLSALDAAPAFADKDVIGSFSGKTVCQNGMKKAGFKDATGNVTYYTLNEVSHKIQSLSWPSPGDTTSFDAREKQKVDLTHVQKLLRQMSCDNQDNPAQSTGIQAGAQNGMQMGTKANGYVQPPAPQ